MKTGSPPKRFGVNARFAWTCAIASSFALGLLFARVASLQAAAEAVNRRDRIWVHPEWEKLEPASIAMIWPSSFVNSFEAERQSDGLWGSALRSSGYRWLGATTSKVLIQPSGASDSLTRAIRESIVRRGRVDSLMARGICRRLRVGALMSLHVDRWEQVEVEFNQSGKPSTTIAFQAALVDSAGRLLWSASGSELAEGPYHDASANVLGVKSSGLGQQPITGQGGPPSFLEVATSLATRLAKALPPKRTVMMDSPLPADTSRR